MEDGKANVLAMKETLDEAGIVEQEATLRQAAGQAFYNTSKFTLRDLRSRASRERLEADFLDYLDGYSRNVQDILDSFEFRHQVPRLSKADALGTLIERVTSPETGRPELPILEVSLRSGVQVRDFENSNRKQVMSDRSLYKRVAKGDIAYNMMRMWQGAVGVAPTDGLVSPAYVVAKPMPGIDSRYFDHLFHTRAYMTEVDKYYRGIVKDRNRLYWEDFKQMPTPCPPSDEQAAIADAVDGQTAVTSACIRNVRSQIGLAHEYRTRLVADVATGKLDVRDVAARLPNEPEDPGTLGWDHSLAESGKEQRSPSGYGTYDREEAIQ